MKRFLCTLMVLALLLSLTACGESSAPTEDTQSPQQETPEPEAAAPEAPPEPEPEAEPEEEPFVIPDPIVYTGSGDDVIEITPFDSPWMLHISGNAEGRHFAVKGYDATGDSVDLFVNTTDPYDGYVFDDTQSTSLLEISANGDWAVEIVSLATLEYVSVDAPISGSGDSILGVTIPDILWALHISGNTGERHFAVKGYDGTLDSTELFVNTTDLYDGITLDPSQSTALLAISAAGDWTVELTEARTLQEANAGDTITGTGDMVIMTDTVGKTATISGNAEGRHFAVKSYSYTDSDLLVNTTDPYEGTVMLKFDPTLLVISAVGDWSITFN